MNTETQQVLSFARSIWEWMWRAAPEQIEWVVCSSRDMMDALRVNNGVYLAEEWGEIDQSILDDVEMRGLATWHLSGGIWSSNIEVRLTRLGRTLCGLV